MNQNQPQPNPQVPVPGGIYPNPEQSPTASQVQPTQPPPQVNPQEPTQQPKSSVTKIILIILAVIIILAAIGGGVSYFILKKMVNTSINSAQNRESDAKVKSDIMNLKVSIENYYSQHNTFVGWVADPQLLSQGQKDGTQIKIQGLSDKTYVIYATLPSNSQIMCADASANEPITITNQPKAQICQ